MKEMEYKKNRILDILHTGTFEGRKFVILSLGHHPTAYVEVRDYEPQGYNEYDLNVNGGATYFGKAHWDKEDNSTYVGWDYAHCEDFSGIWIDRENEYVFVLKKWTTQEIFEEVMIAIKQLNSEEYK